jgi:DMSO/TMAO reductase YedYZ molybdopterin-dependent catalytic subunit
VPTQLGYKSAKYVRRIELVASLGGALGRGGYWEDRDYDWFAGI